MGEKVLGSLQEKGEENEKTQQKNCVADACFADGVQSVTDVIHISTGSRQQQSLSQYRRDDTVTAAPAPVFYSNLTDLSHQSATYYADDSDKVGQLRVQLKYNPSDYNHKTLAILWQVSDDGSTFTDAEGAGTTMSAPWSALMYRRHSWSDKVLSGYYNKQRFAGKYDANSSYYCNCQNLLYNRNTSACGD